MMSKTLRNTIAVISSILLIISCTPAFAPASIQEAREMIFDDPIPMGESLDLDPDLVESGQDILDEATLPTEEDLAELTSNKGHSAEAPASSEGSPQGQSDEMTPDAIRAKILSEKVLPCEEFQGVSTINFHYADKNGQDAVVPVSYGLAPADKSLPDASDAAARAYSLQVGSLPLDLSPTSKVLFWSTSPERDLLGTSGKARPQLSSVLFDNLRIVPVDAAIDHMRYHFDMTQLFGADGSINPSADAIASIASSYAEAHKSDKAKVHSSLEGCASDDGVIDLYAVMGEREADELAADGSAGDDEREATFDRIEEGAAQGGAYDLADDVAGEDGEDGEAGDDGTADAPASQLAVKGADGADGADGAEAGTLEEISPKDSQFRNFVLNSTLGGAGAGIQSNLMALSPMSLMSAGSPTSSPVTIFSAAWYTPDQKPDSDTANLSLNPGYSTSNINDISMAVQLQLNSTSSFKVGSVSVSVPKGLYTTKAGKAAGKITLPDTIVAAPAIADWVYTEYADRYVITNNRVLSASTLFGFDVTVNGLVPKDFDDESTGAKAASFAITASVIMPDGEVIEHATNTLTSTIDHYSEVYKTTMSSTSAITLSKTAPTGVPAMASGDWVYATYYSYASVRGNQPAKLEYTIDPAVSQSGKGDAFQPRVIGYKLSGGTFKASTSTSVTVYENTVTNSTSAGGVYFYVAYPAAWWTTYGSGTTKSNSVKGTVTYKLTDAQDGQMSSSSATATKSFTYEPAPTTSTTTTTDKTYSSYTATKSAGNTYKVLDSIAEGATQDLPWSVSQSYYLAPLTRPNADDPAERASATVTVTDSDILSANSIASGLSLKSLVINTPDGKEYEPTDTTGYAYTSTDTASATSVRYHKVDAGTWAYTSIGKQDVSATCELSLYQGGAWRVVGTISYEDGNVTYALPDLTVTKASTSLTVTPPAGVSAWKVVATTDMAGITMSMRPTYTLDGKDAVVAAKARLLKGSSWSIINRMSSTATSSANSKSISCSDYAYNYVSSQYSTSTATTFTKTAGTNTYASSGIDALYVGKSITTPYSIAATSRWAAYSHDEATHENKTVQYKIEDPNITCDGKATGAGSYLSAITITKPTWYDYTPTTADGYATRICKGDPSKVESSYGAAGTYAYSTKTVSPELELWVKVSGTWSKYAAWYWNNTTLYGTYNSSRVTRTTATGTTVQVNMAYAQATDWYIKATSDSIAGVSGLTVSPTYTILGSDPGIASAVSAKMAQEASSITMSIANKATATLSVIDGESPVTKITNTSSATQTMKASSIASRATATATMKYISAESVMQVDVTAKAGIFTNCTSADFKSLRDAGVASTLATGRYYMLLPFGAVLSEGTVKATKATVTGITTILDWAGTNQTMVVIDVEHTPESVSGVGSLMGVSSFTGYGDYSQIALTARMSLVDYALNGKQAPIKLSYVDYPDNGSIMANQPSYVPETEASAYKKHKDSAAVVKGYEAAWLPETLTGVAGARAVYAQYTATNSMAMAYTTMYKKDASVDGDVAYSDGTTDKRVAREGSLYTYRIDIQQGKGTAADLQKVVLYDYLERDLAFDANDENRQDATWHGSLVSVDTSRLTKQGINNTVYYSTATFERGFTDGTRNYAPDVSDASVWSTEKPADASQVTAIAVDCSKKADGTSQIIKMKEGIDLSVLINMKAPFAPDGDSSYYDKASASEAGLAGGAHAYNRSVMAFDVASGSFFDNKNYLVSQYTKIGLRPFTVNVSASWDDSNNNDGFRPQSLIVRLFDNEGDTGRYVTLTAAGQWKGSIPQVDSIFPDGRKKNFRFVAEGDGTELGLLYPEKYSYTADASMSGDVLTTSIANVHEIEKVTIQGEKIWREDSLMTRPDSVQIELYRNGDLLNGYNRTVTYASGWKYNMGQVQKYSQGKLNQYEVKENGYYRGYVSTYETGEDGSLNVINTLTPFGDLTVRHVYHNTSPVSAEVPSQYELCVYDDDGELYAGEWDVYMNGVLSGQVANGSAIELGKDDVAEIRHLPSDKKIVMADVTKPGFTCQIPVKETMLSSGMSGVLEFVQTYAAEDVIYPSATKLFEGKPLEANAFTFEIVNDKGQIVRQATNSMTGSVNFNPIYFYQADHGRQLDYKLREVSQSKGGYTYDAHEEAMVITVADNGDGTMSVNCDYAGNRTFQNSYEATGPMQITGWTKIDALDAVMRGLGITDEAFLNSVAPAGWLSYALYDDAGNPVYVDADGFQCSPSAPGATAVTGTNNGNGLITMGTVNIDEREIGERLTYYIVPTGVNKQRISEDGLALGVDLSGDISYSPSSNLGDYVEKHLSIDPAVMRYDMTVLDNDDGTLSFTPTQYLTAGTKATIAGASKDVKPSIQFANTFNVGKLAVSKSINANGSSVADTLFKFRVQLVAPDGSKVPIKTQTAATPAASAASTQSASSAKPAASALGSGGIGTLAPGSRLQALSQDGLSGSNAKGAGEAASTNSLSAPTWLEGGADGEGIIDESGISLEEQTELIGSSARISTEGDSVSTRLIDNSKLEEGAMSLLVSPVPEPSFMTMSVTRAAAGPVGIVSQSTLMDGYSDFHWAVTGNGDGTYKLDITGGSMMIPTVCPYFTYSPTDIDNLLRQAMMNGTDPSLPMGMADLSPWGAYQESITEIAFEPGTRIVSSRIDGNRWDGKSEELRKGMGGNLITTYYDGGASSVMPLELGTYFNFMTSLSKVNFDQTDTSGLVNAPCFLKGCESLADRSIESIDTSSIIDMSAFFMGTGYTKLDLSGWDVSNVREALYMFHRCAVRDLDLSTLEFSSLTRVAGGNVSATSYEFEYDDEYANISWFGARADSWSRGIDNANDLPCDFQASLYSYGSGPYGDNQNLRGWFHGSGLSDLNARLNVTATKFPALQSADFLFGGFGGREITGISHISIGQEATPYSWESWSLRSARGMFEGCRNLTTLDLTSISFSQCQLFAKMFYDCNSLETIYVNDSWKSLMVNPTQEMLYRYDAGAKWSNGNQSSGFPGNSMFAYCYALTGTGLYGGTPVTTAYNAAVNCNSTSTYDVPYSSMMTRQYSFTSGCVIMAAYDAETEMGNANFVGSLFTYKDPAPPIAIVTLKDAGKSYAKYTVDLDQEDEWWGERYGMFTFPQYENEDDPDRAEDFHCWREGSWGNHNAPGSVVEVYSDITYEVHIDESVFTLSFNANGGTGTTKPLTFKKREATNMVLPKCSYTRPGYIFKEWAIRAITGKYTAVGKAGDKLESRYWSSNGSLVLYAIWQSENTVTEIGDNTIEFNQRGGQTTTISDLPAGTTYSVYEETTNGWNLVSAGNANGYILPDATQTSGFLNEYAPERAQIIIRSRLDITGYSLDKAGYAFDLFEIGANGAETYKQTAYSTTSGAIEFAPTEFTASGTHSYKIRQNPEAGTKHDALEMIYDDHAEDVTITIAPSDANAAILEATARYDAENLFTNTVPPTKLDVTSLVHNTEDATKEFTYSVEVFGRTAYRVQMAHEGTHQVTEIPHGASYVVEQVTSPAGYMFSHVEAKSVNDVTGLLTGEARAQAESRAARAAGASGASGALAGPGDASPDAAAQGALATSSVEPVAALADEERVPYDPDAMIVPANRIQGQASNKGIDLIAFHNDYETSGEVTFAAHKVLAGDGLAAGQFSFELLRAGVVLGTASNDDAGNVTFQAVPVDLADNGAAYQIKEVVDSSDARITYDESEKIAEVSVEDNADGTCTTSASYPDGNEFTNRVNGATFDVGVEVDGYFPDEEREFTIVISIVARDGSQLQEEIEYTLDDSDEVIVLPPATDLMLRAGQVAHLRLPDGSTATIMEVSPNGYKCEEPSIEQQITGGQSYEHTFTLTYSAFSIFFPQAKVVVEGAPLRYNELTVDLMNESGRIIERMANNEMGEVFFSGLEYTHEDVGREFTYSLKQEPGDAYGYTYAENVVPLHMTIKDNGDGTLEFDCLYGDSSEIPIFVNSYAVMLPSTGNIGLVSLGVTGWLIVVASIIFDKMRKRRIRLEEEDAASGEGEIAKA